ncbi:MAG TPA: hypothetical protein VFT72_07485 [Opitutaceae bacterium]|nr:hypothetical protein [Opitutaceae bacterium]
MRTRFNVAHVKTPARGAEVQRAISVYCKCGYTSIAGKLSND